MSAGAPAARADAAGDGAPAHAADNDRHVGGHDGRCGHCRGPTAPGQRFCCPGCEAVHLALVADGLADWGRLRDADDDAIAGVPAQPRADRDYAFLATNHYRDRHCQSVTFADGSAGQATAWAVDGMTCVACAWAIEELARRQPGVRDARVDLIGQRLALTVEPSARLDDLARALGRIGYGVGLAGQQDPQAARRRDLVAVAVAGAVMGNTMLLTLPHYAGLQSSSVFADLFGGLSCLLGVVALAGPGRVFFVQAGSALRSGRVGLDLPLALGLAAAWGHSSWQLLRGAHEAMFFDSLAMLVFTLRLGRFFQARAVEAAAARARMLAATMPTLTPTLRDGAWLPLVPADLRRGDVARIDPGAVLPCEATLLEVVARAGPGEDAAAPPALSGDGPAAARDAAVDLHVITGESAPRRVAMGGALPAGARAIDDGLVVRIEAPVDDIAADDADLARDERLAVDRLGPPFTLAVLAVALAAGLYWTQAAGWPRGIEIAMVVLIVACPCALGLASPVTVALAVADAARRGVLIRRPAVLERLATIHTVVFDKTGTVTEGRPQVVAAWTPPVDEALSAWPAALADVEATSRHPIARALARHGAQASGDAARHLPAEAIRLPGEGMQGVSRGVRVWALSPTAATRRGWTAPTVAPFVSQAHAAGQSVVLVWAGPSQSSDAPPTLVGAVALQDALRADAAATVATLRSRWGVEVALLSGDAAAVVARLAPAIGVQAAHGDVDPAGKAAHITACAARGGVAMVGDGENDVDALRAATVAVSLAGATAAAIRQAEVVLQSGGLAGLVWLFGRAAAARAALRLTLIVAGTYNLVAVAAAAAGWLSPLVGIVAMPASSLTVTALAFALARRAR